MDLGRERNALVKQANACHAMGSPLYGNILDRCSGSADRGAFLSLLASRPRSEDLTDAAIPLRVLATIHRLALSGKAPALAASYPSCGGGGSVERAWYPFVEAMRANTSVILAEIERPVQTNEVARAAALIGGFLTVCKRLGKPLRLLELGASAGLLLRWDQYRYEARTWHWGQEDASVRFSDNFTADSLPFDSDTRVEIVDRRGCDLAPFDLQLQDDRSRLFSYVWPDQTARLDALRAACAVAQNVVAVVDKASAPEWLEKQLKTAYPGVATVIFHSVFKQYLSPEDRLHLEAVLRQAAANATDRAPLAYLCLEPSVRDEENILLELWPMEETVKLGRSTMHGRNITWSQL